MKRFIAGLLAGWFCLAGLGVQAAHTRATLLLEKEVARPGDTILAAVRLQMDTGWHTFWKNPGGSGTPTKVEWALPQGITAGELQWPTPEKLVPAATDANAKEIPGQFDYEWTTYIYHDEVVLLLPLTVAASVKHGALELKGEVSWQECQEACVQGKQNVAGKIQIGSESKPSSDADLIASAKKKLPSSGAGLNARASWEGAAGGDTRPLLLEWSGPSQVDQVDFFPEASEQFEVQAKTETIPAASGTIRLRKQVKKLEGDWPKEISGELIVKTAGNLQGFAVKLPITDSAGGQAPTATSTQSLWRMLLYAFIGGLILNVMPCVFPVIALKIFGFVQQSRDEPRRVFKLGLIYALGVLASFLIMAGLVIAIKQAGGSASWGMQFKSPQISVGFIALVVLIALNLFGVFEVNLGGGAMSAAGQLASKHGSSGAFFNGVLATVLATPCTAPILATALGFAFAQPPLGILLFFLTIGLGLAFPYVLLSCKPGWLKFLPRPGVWMEKFKVAMGFPMLATAVWIFWFTAPRFGDDGVIWIGFFLIGLSFAAWIWGGFVQQGGKRRGLATLISLAVLLTSYGYALENQLHWRTPVKPATAGELQNKPDGVQWQPWSAKAVQAARDAGRPVLVDFTASWCLTCNKFVKPAVDNRDVRQKLDAINGVALLADYSYYPSDIAAELRKFHADGAVPLVLVYSHDASQRPEVLPTVPTRKEVLEALTKAAP